MFYATQEEERVEQVRREALSGNIRPAQRLAYQYAREEEDVAEESLEQFATALSMFTGRNSPKVVLYFADTLRAEPGQHYRDMLGLLNDRLAMEDDPCRTGATPNPYSIPRPGVFSFDHLVAAAQAAGVRVYAVLAQGLSHSNARVNAAENALRQLGS